MVRMVLDRSSTGISSRRRRRLKGRERLSRMQAQEKAQRHEESNGANPEIG